MRAHKLRVSCLCSPTVIMPTLDLVNQFAFSIVGECKYCFPFGIRYPFNFFIKQYRLYFKMREFCSKCLKRGHSSDLCRGRVKIKQNRQSKSYITGSICSFCKKRGHTRWECYFAKQKQSGENPENLNKSSTPEESQPVDEGFKITISSKNNTKKSADSNQTSFNIKTDGLNRDANAVTLATKNEVPSDLRNLLKAKKEKKRVHSFEEDQACKSESSRVDSANIRHEVFSKSREQDKRCSGATDYQKVHMGRSHNEMFQDQDNFRSEKTEDDRDFLFSSGSATSCETPQYQFAITLNANTSSRCIKEHQASSESSQSVKVVAKRPIESRLGLKDCSKQEPPKKPNNFIIRKTIEPSKSKENITLANRSDQQSHCPSKSNEKILRREIVNDLSADNRIDPVDVVSKSIESKPVRLYRNSSSFNTDTEKPIASNVAQKRTLITFDVSPDRGSSLEELKPKEPERVSSHFMLENEQRKRHAPETTSIQMSQPSVSFYNRSPDDDQQNESCAIAFNTASHPKVSVDQTSARANLVPVNSFERSQNEKSFESSQVSRFRCVNMENLENGKQALSQTPSFQYQSFMNASATTIPARQFMDASESTRIPNSYGQSMMSCSGQFPSDNIHAMNVYPTSFSGNNNSSSSLYACEQQQSFFERPSFTSDHVPDAAFNNGIFKPFGENKALLTTKPLLPTTEVQLDNQTQANLIYMPPKPYTPQHFSSSELSQRMFTFKDTNPMLNVRAVPQNQHINSGPVHNSRISPKQFSDQASVAQTYNEIVPNSNLGQAFRQTDHNQPNTLQSGSKSFVENVPGARDAQEKMLNQQSVPNTSTQSNLPNSVPHASPITQEHSAESSSRNQFESEVCQNSQSPNNESHENMYKQHVRTSRHSQEFEGTKLLSEQEMDLLEMRRQRHSQAQPPMLPNQSKPLNQPKSSAKVGDGENSNKTVSNYALKAQLLLRLEEELKIARARNAMQSSIRQQNVSDEQCGDEVHSKKDQTGKVKTIEIDSDQPTNDASSETHENSSETGLLESDAQDTMENAHEFIADIENFLADCDQKLLRDQENLRLLENRQLEDQRKQYSEIRSVKQWCYNCGQSDHSMDKCSLISPIEAKSLNQDALGKAYAYASSPSNDQEEAAHFSPPTYSPSFDEGCDGKQNIVWSSYQVSTSDGQTHSSDEEDETPVESGSTWVSYYFK